MRRLFFSVSMIMSLFLVYFNQGNANTIYLVKHFSTTNGLTNNQGYTIAQDGKGFIWIGTNEGINRFDGFTFQHFLRNTSGENSVVWNRIFHLIQDQEGDIWISSDAVSHYDVKKEKFTHWKYDPNSPYSLANNRINNTVIDHEGNAWIATWEGVNVIEKATGKITTMLPENCIHVNNSNVQVLLDENVPANVISATSLVLNHCFNSVESLTDSLNQLVNDSTLIDYIQYAASYATRKRNDNSLLERSVSQVHVDPHGRIWFGYHQAGISSFDPVSGKFNHYPAAIDNKKSTGDLINYLEFSENKVWIGTTQEGLKVLDLATEQSHSITTDGERYISHLRLDGNDLWISDNKGVLVYEIHTGNYHRIRLFHPDYGIMPQMITRCTFKDNQGNIWIGTDSKGVFLLESHKGFRYFETHLLSVWEDTDQSVTSVNQDKYGNFWLGYASGKVEVVSSTGEVIKVIRQPLQNEENLSLDVFSIYRDRNDFMWVSYYEGGIDKFDSKGKMLKSFRHHGNTQTSILGNDIRDIASDEEGNLYFAIHGKGISILDKESGLFKHITTDPENPLNSLYTNWVYKLKHEPNNNELWVSTVGGISVYSIENDSFVHYNFGQEENSFSAVMSFFKDSRGLFWIGTEYGLIVFHPQTKEFIRFTNEDGLSSNLVNSVAEDLNHNIWLATAKGIDLIDLETLPFHRDSLFSRLLTVQVRNHLSSFNQADGLISDNFTNSNAYQSADGWLFFGTTHGVVSFHPDSITFNYTTTPVYITGISLFNKPVNVNDHTGILSQSISSSDKITLKHHQNVITFRYVSPIFSGTQKVQYAYKLEGFDEDWNYVNNSRDATYTNLNSGNYRFIVKSTNSDGIWGEEYAAMEVVVRPPFWKTPPAFLFYTLIFLGALMLLKTILMIKAKAKLEIEKMQEIDALKTKFFTNISHEIRTPLTLISGPLKKLIEQKEHFNWQEDFHLVSLMHRNLVRLQYLVNQYLDFRKVDNRNIQLNVCNADIVSYILEIKQAFEYVALEKEIDFRLTSDNKSITTWFDPEIIEKISFNLLSNAFKYTPQGGTIEISISLPGSTGSKNKKADTTSGFLSISIKDSGVGIPESLRARIFERYFQIKTPENKNKRGTGIGLSFAKELVEIHKGRIEIEPVNPSCFQDGSIFTFYIPFGKEHYEGCISDQKPEEMLRKTITELPVIFKPLPTMERSTEIENQEEELPLILIIEDNPEVRYYLNHELGSQYRILETDTAESGFEIALNEIPDLIVSDIMLPGMNGEDLCFKLKNEFQTDHIPVILLTARFGDTEKIAGLASGADVYMTKPFIPEELNIRIKNLIETRKKIMEKFNHDFQQKPLSVIKQCADDKFLKKALSVIEDNLSNSELDVDFMTGHMGISRAQLYRKFNAVSNQTVKGFVKSVRLKKAAELLARGDMNVSEVAYSVGFSDLAYFTRCFKSAYQKTPSAFASEYGLKENM